MLLFLAGPAGGKPEWPAPQCAPGEVDMLRIRSLKFVALGLVFLVVAPVG